MLPYKDTIYQTVIIVTKQFETNYGLFKHDVISQNSPLQQKVDINLGTRKNFLEMALLSLKIHLIFLTFMLIKLPQFFDMVRQSNALNFRSFIYVYQIGMM